MHYSFRKLKLFFANASSDRGLVMINTNYHLIETQGILHNIVHLIDNIYCNHYYFGHL